MKDVIIIGSGPAGVSASLYTARANLDTTIISMNNGSLQKADLIQNYYGFADAISGKELADNAIVGAKKVGVNFLDEEVVGISFLDNFVVETTSNRYETKNILLATGSTRATPNIKGIKEFEGKGVSYCAVCDAFFYRGKNVAVLGGSEFAIHELQTLSPIVNSAILLTNGEKFDGNVGDVKVIEKKISSISGDDKIRRVHFDDGDTVDIDGLFIAMGVAGSTALARKIGAEVDGNKIVVDENFSTNIPGLFAAGDCVGGLLQVSKAVYEGAKAGTEIIKRNKSLK